MANEDLSLLAWTVSRAPKVWEQVPLALQKVPTKYLGHGAFQMGTMTNVYSLGEI